MRATLRTAAMIGAAVALVPGLAGCSTNSSSGSSAPANNKVGVLLPDTASSQERGDFPASAWVVICSGMAAISGMIAASRRQSVQSNAGAGNTLLVAVGAAVIGGTSLFGGRGRILDAVLGGLVVAVIVNGMSNLIQGANSSGYEFIVTGAVLLLAAGFDAIVRRRRAG